MRSAILDIMSMLGCRIRLHEFEHEGQPVLRLSLDVDERHAEVLLDFENARDLESALREHLP